MGFFVTIKSVKSAKSVVSTFLVAAIGRAKKIRVTCLAVALCEGGSLLRAGPDPFPLDWPPQSAQKYSEIYAPYASEDNHK